MNTLFIDTISAPNEIKNSIKNLFGHIKFTKEVCKGCNGFLFFGLNTLIDREVAVKYYYWGGEKRFHAEPKRLAEINSPNVLKIYDAALMDNDWAYFITPFCPVGDLDDALSIQAMGNIHATSVTSQILNGLAHLHSSNYLHRDLKPANIFLDESGLPLIGDFGSVRLVPEGDTEVPGSGHSILYRPPESIETGKYKVQGDIYQVGIVLFQLLGGYLPYEEKAWLNKTQLNKYGNIQDDIDKSLFIDDILKEKIKKGRLLDLGSLPPWVPSKLRRTISKACNVNPSKRFDSASSFSAHLLSLVGDLKNWGIQDGLPTLQGPTSFRLFPIKTGDSYFVEKRKTGGWKRANSFGAASLGEQVKKIEDSL